MFLESVIFMAAYIPLRSFAGGYHAKTPVRCYILSLIMITVVLAGTKYLPFTNVVYYVILAVTVLIVLLLSPVEDKNKSLNRTENKVYKKSVMIITATELVICLILRLTNYNGLFILVIYSFGVLSFMLVVGKIKNQLKR